MNEALFTGLGVGGPMDGRQIESRYPKGVVFVSKPTNRSWIYDFYTEQSAFYVRPAGYDLFWSEMSEQDRLNVVRATVLTGIDPTRELNLDEVRGFAESSEFEVRALPEESREVI